MPIRFDPSASVFVLFRTGESIEKDRVNSVTRDGEPLASIGHRAHGATAPRELGIELVRGEGGALEAQVWQPGTYTLTGADDSAWQFEARVLPEPVEISGAWELQFPPKAGAPERVTLHRLMSWSEHSDPKLLL